MLVLVSFRRACDLMMKFWFFLLTVDSCSSRSCSRQIKKSQAPKAKIRPQSSSDDPPSVAMILFSPSQKKKTAKKKRFCCKPSFFSHILTHKIGFGAGFFGAAITQSHSHLPSPKSFRRKSGKRTTAPTGLTGSRATREETSPIPRARFLLIEETMRGSIRATNKEDTRVRP